MGYTMSISVEATFVILPCYLCGIEFGMPDNFEKKRRNDHGDFYCPNGHGQHFNAKTEAERLRDELNAARNETARVRMDLGQEMAAHRKLQRRIARGVCPHCTRTFANIQRHMEKKHPE